MAKRTIVDFDELCYQCHYSTSESPANDGFGCLHPEADEAETDPKTGLTVGRCRNSGCPLVCALDDEDLRSPDLDWDGYERDDLTGSDGRVLDDGQFATIRCDEAASFDEKKLLYHYRRYLHRYDKDWLEKHREEP